MTKDTQIGQLLSENASLRADNLLLTQQVASLEAKVLLLLEQIEDIDGFNQGIWITDGRMKAFEQARRFFRKYGK